MQPHETKAGPGVAAPEPRCIAQQASAQQQYPLDGSDSNQISPLRLLRQGDGIAASLGLYLVDWTTNREMEKV